MKSQKNIKYPQKPKKDKPEKTFAEKIENFFEKNIKYIFILSLFFTILFSFLVFNVRIHEGGDDSGYIEMGYNFIKGKSFPSWHGELYAIFLGILIGIFGLKVFILKLSSLVFIVLQLVFIYLAFKNKISSIILAFTLLITSTCYNILFHSSQTYSEAFYIFTQAFLIYLTYKYFLEENQINNSRKLNIINYIIFGLLLFICYNIRNIGVSFTIAIIIFLLLQKRFLNIGYILTSFALFNILYQLYKKIVWNTSSLSFFEQLNAILYKDYYNPSEGRENLTGMIIRFYENAKNYLSYHILSSIGLWNPENLKYNIIPAVIITLVCLYALYISYKKNKYIFFLCIYLFIAIGATFISLHQMWSQNRLIIIFLPIILITILYGLLEISKIKKLRFLFYLTFILFSIIFVRTISFTLKKAEENSTTLRKNLAGDKYYGFTPDWENFLKMSEWVSKNIPDSIKVASRKPSMSFIYGNGREFFPIYRLPTIPPEKLIKEIKNNNQNFIAFDFLGYSKKNISFDKNLFIRSFVKLLIENDSLLYAVANPENYYNEYLNLLRENNVKTINDADSLITFFNNIKQPYYGIDPDYLVMNLKNNKVEYLILASLRMNPAMKTDRIINTIHRYAYFIECKYPGIFTIVHKIGDNNNEPTYLIKINYNLYQLKNN